MKISPLAGVMSLAAALGLAVGIFGFPVFTPESQTLIATPASPSNAESPVSQYPGKVAPNFSLPDQNGMVHTLASVRGKWVVLAFYPMDGSSACTMQNKTYTAQKNEFDPLNAVVYTVSTQDVTQKKAFVQQAGLSHILLSDAGGKVSRTYSAYIDGPGMASRVTFYIRPDGTVAAVDDAVRVMTAAADSVKRLKELQATEKKTPSY